MSPVMLSTEWDSLSEGVYHVAVRSSWCLQPPAEARQWKVSTVTLPYPIFFTGWLKLIVATTQHQAWIMLFTLNYIYVIIINIFSGSSSMHCCQSWRKPLLGGICSVTLWKLLENLRQVSLPIGHPSLVAMCGLSFKCYFEAWEICS